MHPGVNRPGRRGGVPLVEVVDNFTNNRRLATLFEGRIGPGRLVVASFDLETELENRPAARQMLCSLLDYMNGDRFDPAAIENPQSLRGLMRE